MDKIDDDSLWVLPGPNPTQPAGSTPGSGLNMLPERDRSESETAVGILQCGKFLASRFEIGSRIGQGGMGTVYEARDTLRNEAVAIKVLVPGLLLDPEAVRQFQSEAAIATQLSHPNIVTVYGIHASEGIHGMVMERLRGKTLRDEINERKRSKTPFSTSDVERILGPVCQALEYAHAFTVHRDVKPENVWICDDGDGHEDGTVKLMDFGLAMLVQRSDDPLSLYTLSQLRLGSPYYMAPEQLQNARRVTAAVDQFALGVITYELLSGTLPIGLAKPLRKLRPDFPYLLTDTVDRALASDPEARFPTVAAFWETFRAGCRSRRSWRQHLDSRPLLRKTAIVLAAVGAFALVVSWGDSIVNRRADTLMTKSTEASNALQAARSEISAVRLLVDEMERAHQESEFALKTVREKDPPDANDISALLQREIDLAGAERKFAEADWAWQLLSPRLNDEKTPFVLINRLADLEEMLRAHDFSGFDRGRVILEQAITNERATISQTKALAASRVAMASLNLGHGDGLEGGIPEDDLVAGDGAAGSLHPESDFAEALDLAASQAAEKALAEELRVEFDSMVAAHDEAIIRWKALFPKTGPPPIEFLGHPAAKAQAASGWQSINRYDRALQLLTEAVATVNSWAKEVEDLHQRCDGMWTEAVAKGRAFENVLGMRFVRIGDGNNAHYWSIWETRVMDFAWAADLHEWKAELAGTFWKDPGVPIGPTFPVVGLEPELARDFGKWISLQFRDTTSSDYDLPTIELYQSMLSRDPEWQVLEAKRAVFPFNQRVIDRHWMNKLADPDISPQRFIRQVGLGEASAQGLYDLFGNTWEWAGDFLSSEGHENHLGRDYLFPVLYGGGEFGHISYSGNEPPADHIFVGRLDALGFRFVIHARGVDERLGRVPAETPTQSQLTP